MSETQAPYGGNVRDAQIKVIRIDAREAEEMAKVLKVSALGFRSPRAKELLSKLARLLRETPNEMVF